MSDTTLRLEKFKSFYTVIRDELLDHTAKVGIPPDAVDWYRKNIDYNVPNGKCVRGTFIVDVIEILQGHPLTEEEYQRAAVLGWCCELFQASFLVYDDIMDVSTMRRGKPCWYRNEHVGMIAINDALMLEAAIFRLLKVYFRSEPYYTDIVDLFHELVYMTAMGQVLDLITAPQDVVDLAKFSVERHRTSSNRHTPPPSFPSECTETNPYELAKSILLPIGIYYQDQDDFLDFAGSPECFGKIGSDILDNKCSWCIVTALNLATPQQRTILEENYGKKDKECEGRVREIFEEIGIRNVYKEYEDKAVREIREVIEGVVDESGLKREVFEGLLGKIYKRTK
ncbi:isoprenoid synthase domain-containing protein [Cyathus striatus]|nr:isoprenoid synthase domain-containing protein [Cyathus striatus]